MIWNYEIDEIEKGYHEAEHEYECLFCGEKQHKGRIYVYEDDMYDAYGAIKRHIEQMHGGSIPYLLKQDTNVNGLTSIQSQILKMVLEFKTDQQISETLGIAQSTVRNHKFKIREKEKQAKVFLAITQGLNQIEGKRISQSDQGAIQEIHKDATMVDERYVITEKEKEKVIATYLDDTGKILQFPAKAKKKIIILYEVIKNFKQGKEYSEIEINRILKRIYEEDFAGVRRALIEYGFMDRNQDGSIYRRKE